MPTVIERQQLFGPGRVAEKIIIGEGAAARAERLYLRYHLGHRPHPVARAQERGDGTERAVMGAAARGFYRVSGQRDDPGEEGAAARSVIKFFIYQVVARHGPARHGRARQAFIGLLRRAGAEIFDEARPGLLSLPHDHRVGVGERLFGLHADMDAAHHHVRPAAAELVGYVVGPRYGLGIAGDADEVGPRGVIDLLQHVDADLHLVAGRDQGREAGQGIGRGKADARLVHAAVAAVPGGLN